MVVSSLIIIIIITIETVSKMYLWLLSLRIKDNKKYT